MPFLVAACAIALGAIAIVAASGRSADALPPPPIASAPTAPPPRTVEAPPRPAAAEQAEPALPSRAAEPAPRTAETVLHPPAAESAPHAGAADPAPLAAEAGRATAATEAPAALPWMDDGAARHGNGTARHAVSALAWTMPSPMAVYETLEVDARIPVDGAGNALPTAADVVLLFPFPTEGASVAGLAAPLAERYGFTLLDVRFPLQGSSRSVVRGAREDDYYFVESGSDRAWIQALDGLRARCRLPVRRVFAFGRSGGGSAAHRFSEAHPDLVEACAVEAGKVFVETPAFPGPQLYAYGEGDAVEPDNLRLIAALAAAKRRPEVLPFRANQQMRASGSYLRCHGMTAPTAEAVWAWIAGWADRRLTAGPAAGRLRAAQAPEEPSPHFSQARARLPPASRPLDGGGAIVRPASPPRGVVLLAAHGDPRAAVELLLDGHALADAGFTAVVRPLGSGAELGTATAAAVRLAAEASTPLAVAIDRADAADLRALRGAPVTRLLLVRPDQSIWADWRDPRVPALVLAPPAAVWPLRKGVAAPRRGPLPAAGSAAGAWHVALIGTLVRFLDGNADEPAR